MYVLGGIRAKFRWFFPAAWWYACPLLQECRYHSASFAVFFLCLLDRQCRSFLIQVITVWTAHFLPLPLLLDTYNFGMMNSFELFRQGTHCDWMGVFATGVCGSASFRLVLLSCSYGKVCMPDGALTGFSDLDAFVHSRSWFRYQRVFKFLLRLKRLSVAFSLLWRNLRGARSSRRLEYGDYLELFRWHYTYSHVITAIQGFIQVNYKADRVWVDGLYREEHLMPRVRQQHSRWSWPSLRVKQWMNCTMVTAG